MSPAAKSNRPLPTGGTPVTSQFRPVRVALTESDHRIANEIARSQFERARELGWRDKSFSEKYGSGAEPVYFGELGEIAVGRLFDRLGLPFVRGLKGGVTRPEDITHDFYVAGKSIGVKTEVPNWCNSTWEFVRRTRFGCIYTVRSSGSGYGGSHGDPDLLIHCLYFPHVAQNTIWVTGFVSRITLLSSPVRSLFGKPMHCISPYKFECIDMIGSAIL